MSDLAIDFSYTTIPAASAKGAGYIGAFMYLSNDPAKNATPARVNDWLSNGLGVGLVWETTAQAALGGTPAGTSDGHAARAQASALGAPLACPILANIGDWAVLPQELGIVATYYRAFQAAAGQAGGYGTSYVINYCVNTGCTGYWWQNAMNDQTDLGASVSPNATIYQRVTPTKQIPGIAPGSYDENVMLKPFTWWTSSPTPPPTPPPVVQPPTIIQGDDDMAPTVEVDNNQRHVYVANANGSVTHWWQNIGSAGWAGPEILPAPPPPAA